MLNMHPFLYWKLNTSNISHSLVAVALTQWQFQVFEYRHSVHILAKLKNKTKSDPRFSDFWVGRKGSNPMTFCFFPLTLKSGWTKNFAQLKLENGTVKGYHRSISSYLELRKFVNLKLINVFLQGYQLLSRLRLWGYLPNDAVILGTDFTVEDSTHVHYLVGHDLDEVTCPGY